MTNQEILTKAIQKAIDGGWDMFKHRKDSVPPWYIVRGGEMPTPKVVEAWVPEDSLLICGYQDFYFVWEHVIYNHEFAKALWSDMYKTNLPTAPNWVDHFDPAKINKPAWQYHLQQMVIADDSIKYLGENT